MKSSRFIQNLESWVTDSLSLLETASPCGEVSLTRRRGCKRWNSRQYATGMGASE
jgi:hypothetical protein